MLMKVHSQFSDLFSLCGHHLGYSIVCLIFSIAIASCTGQSRRPPPELNGIFNGTDTDGKTITLSLNQKQNVVRGVGTWGEQSISISALTAPRGPMVLSTDTGRLDNGYIQMSADGRTVTVNCQRAELILERSNQSVSRRTGPFQGHFERTVPTHLWLDLEQNHELLAGTGYINGQPVAVVGKIVGHNKVKGTLLYSDASRIRVASSLSEDGNTLIVTGIGGTIELKRR